MSSQDNCNTNLNLESVFADLESQEIFVGVVFRCAEQVLML